MSDFLFYPVERQRRDRELYGEDYVVKVKEELECRGNYKLFLQDKIFSDIWNEGMLNVWRFLRMKLLPWRWLYGKGAAAIFMVDWQAEINSWAHEISVWNIMTHRNDDKLVQYGASYKSALFSSWLLVILLMLCVPVWFFIRIPFVVLGVGFDAFIAPHMRKIGILLLTLALILFALGVAVMVFE